MIKDHPLTLTSKQFLDKKIMKLLGDNPSTKYRVTVQEWSKKRSLTANAQYHVWIPAISEFICEDIKTTTNTLKLEHGLPIILADVDVGHKVGFLLDKIGFQEFTKEQQINVMDLISVTSLMSTKQHNQMRDSIMHFYNTAGLDIGYKD